MLIIRFIFLMVAILTFLVSRVCNEMAREMKKMDEEYRIDAKLMTILYYLVLMFSTACFIKSIM